MNKTLAACIILLAAAGAASAQEARDIGVGIVLGDTLGATGKLWLDKTSAVDLALGADAGSGNFTMYGDYLFHGWKAFPQPAQGKLAAYLGGGPRIQVRGDDTEFGVRAVLGASYFLKDPVEFFAEIGPLFRFTPDGGVYPVGSVGLRYYFKAWN